MAETVSYDVLRRTRVQLDVVAMLLWRKMWATLDLSTVNIFMYADGSPQWRGKELYAVTMDVIIDTGSDRKIMRRMFPILELGLNALSARGKALATLWMLHLMVGPYTSRFLDVLTRVRSITTDLGTERKLAHMVDCAPEFWAYLGLSKDHLRRRTWLFPRAVQVPGWAHIFDNLIRLGLSSLAWFPGFLESLKGMLKLLRDFGGDICCELRSLNRESVAQLLESARLPYFAAWRWGTLSDVCKVSSDSHPTIFRCLHLMIKLLRVSNCLCCCIQFDLVSLYILVYSTG